MSDRLSDYEVNGLARAAAHTVPGGRRLLLLAREVQASRKVFAALRALHADEDGFWHGGYCQQDGSEMPCLTIRLIDEAGL